MIENSDNSEIELKIIEAANTVFLKYGIENATMGQIADEAEISRTSLNYYFKSKSNLLERVLLNLERQVLPVISIYLNNNDLSLIEKVELFIDDYLELVIKYPMVPSFILSELNREPGWLIQLIKNRNLNFEKLSVQIADEIEKGTVIPFKLEDLFVNLVGLCVFPIISKPIMMEFFYEQDETKYNQFLNARKTEVKRIIRNWLKSQ
jgi:AcrR family transcriptional regulator